MELDDIFQNSQSFGMQEYYCKPQTIQEAIET